ncbi:Fc.00g080790.m01.CDS01 [Cosmosporella sp. VM-42]
MPPKPYRRTTRVSSREPDPAPRERPGQFARPHLPSLSGTPSSRRQYSYGSALEPPQRPGAGSQKVDISNAVSEALTRRPEDLDDEVFVRPPRPQARQSVDTEEDELAQDNRATGMTGADATRSNANNPFANLNPPRQNVAGSDVDSLRSFGTESDYYRDATIASTPGTTPAVEEPYHTRLAAASRLKPLPEGRLPDITSSEAPSQTRPTDPTMSRPGRPGVGQRVGTTQPQQQPLQNSSDSEEEEEEEEEEDEEEYDPRNSLLGHERYTNTPGPKSMASTTRRDPRMRSGLRSQQNADSPESEEEGESPESQGTLHVARLQPGSTSTMLVDRPQRKSRRLGKTTFQPQSQATRKDFNIHPAPKTLFKSGGGRRLGSADDDHVTPEEESPAVQGEIQEAEEQLARERREHEEELLRRRNSLEMARELTRRKSETEAYRRRWRQRWEQFMSLFSLEFLRRRLRNRRQAQNDDDDLGDIEAEPPVNYWQLLNPLTYLQSLVWLFDEMMYRVVNFFDNVSPAVARGRIPRPGSAFRWILIGVLAMVMGMGLVSPLLSSLSTPSVSFPSPPSLNIGLPSFGGLTSKIGGAIPSFTWSSPKDDGTGDMWEESDEKSQKEVESYLKRYKQEINMLKRSGKLSQASLNKLEALIPKIVHMDLKDGKPVIAPDFWHALKDLIRCDGEIFILEKKGGKSESTPEQQWEALVDRLAKDPTFTSKLNVTTDAGGKLETKMGSFWDSWIKKNNDKIIEALGPALEKVQSAGSGREFDKRFANIVKEQLKGDNLRDVVVTRDEFLHHLKNEFAAHSTEIRAELNELQPQLENLIRESVKLASKNTPSKSDVENIVHGIVRKAIADMNLAALAKGEIQMHWDHDLKHQVNFFNLGSGAIIDGKRTSPPYDPHQKGVVTDEDFKKGIRGVKPYPALAALVPWQDEGDCFCAARTINRRGNPHGASVAVLLPHLIIPTHIVVEHILPGATIDADARPKDIEIWAHIADHATRERVRDFVAVKFPDDTGDWNYEAPEYDEHFVKVGQFVYEGAELHDGVHVHRLSDELAEIGAMTDQVVIRAVSNYGAKHHTCFYRVRVFGELKG